MGGGTFIVGVLLLFFLLWVFAGGPSRPISFSGPYITPITNEGQTQAGYGPQVKVGGTVTLPGATISATERGQTSSSNSSAATSPASTQSAPASTQTSASSPSSSGITLTHVAGDTNNPDGYIQIALSSAAGASVDITNDILTSSSVRESGEIPTGILLMRLGTGNTLQEIILKPGGKAVVAPGASPVQASFEANTCSGYLTSNESEYNSCVTAHVNDAGFLLGWWYVYLGRTSSLWKASDDTVSLLDGSDNVIAQTSY